METISKIGVAAALSLQMACGGRAEQINNCDDDAGAPVNAIILDASADARTCINTTEFRISPAEFRAESTYNTTPGPGQYTEIYFKIIEASTVKVDIFDVNGGPEVGLFIPQPMHTGWESRGWWTGHTRDKKIVKFVNPGKYRVVVRGRTYKSECDFSVEGTVTVTK